jgi:hypothetical protein
VVWAEWLHHSLIFVAFKATDLDTLDEHHGKRLLFNGVDFKANQTILSLFRSVMTQMARSETNTP